MVDSAQSRDAALLVDRLRDDLVVLGSLQRSVGAKNYLKTDLTHLGVSVPDVRASTKHLLKQAQVSDRAAVLGAAEALWKQPVFELRLASIEVLIANRDLLEAHDLKVCEQRLRKAHTWALVDPMSIDVVGPIVAANPDDPFITETLNRWVNAQDFWLPRAALLSQLRIVKSPTGDPTRFFSYADQLVEQREFFIAKAIGWILRDMSRKRAELVFEWLLPHAGQCSPVTFREAIKYLSEEQRAQVIAARATALS